MKYLLFILCFSFSIFSSNIELPEYLLFIGNPGVGKSILINSLVGDKVFESGISPKHITEFFQRHEHNGKYYFDTPGLADMEMRERAAIEIEKSLKQDGKYRLFFVITLEAGRVKPEDVTTINLVMEAIKNPNKNFNVLINKVSRREEREIFENPAKLAIVYEQINFGKHKTDSIYYINYDRSIDDGDTEFITIDDDLSNFLFEQSLFVSIKKEEIDNIRINEFEEIKAHYEESLSIMREVIKSNEESISILREQMRLTDEKYNNLFSELKNMQDYIRKLEQQPKKQKRNWLGKVSDCLQIVKEVKSIILN